MADDLPAGVGRLGGSPVFGCGIVILLAGAIAGITASLVVVWLDEDYDAELVELSVAILSGDYAPRADEAARVRQFALDALERATGATLTDADRAQWLEGSEPLLPAGLCAAPHRQSQ